jgi:hypothetical protein
VGIAVKTNLGKWLGTLLVTLGNLLFWAMPSKLAYNVAQQRDILLGRYTVDRLTTLLLLIPVSLLIINGIWSSKKQKLTKEKKRQCLFKIIALSVSIIVSILLADIFVRLAHNRQYVKKTNYYHRVPNTIQKGINSDVPPTAFSYPATPAGYPDIDYTLTIDKRGFRNKTDLGKYDVVILGDSFTEGSGVSDNQAWPTLFAQKSNRTVYNLGMSAGTPATYLETLRKFGLELSPKIVICMLYEGNDFRSSNFSPKKIEHRTTLRTFYKSSPLRQSIKRALIRSLGPVNSNRFKIDTLTSGNKTKTLPPYHPLYALSWLPLAVPDRPDAKYYAFKIKRLLAHFTTKDAFLNSMGCQGTFSALREVKKTCSQRNIRFIVTYTPDKPHILLPLVRHKLPPDKLHAFMALKQKNLPPSDELFDILLPRLNAQEAALEDFCRAESIEFVSFTQPLRQEILKARQAYFTYDQHWTPIGHETAANTLHHYIENSTKEKQ